MFLIVLKFVFSASTKNIRISKNPYYIHLSENNHKTRLNKTHCKTKNLRDEKYDRRLVLQCLSHNLPHVYNDMYDMVGDH